MVNVIVRFSLPKTRDSKNYSRSMRSYFNYLHREQNYFMRFSNTQLSDIQFARIYGDKIHYRFIVSPKEDTDFSCLVDKTIEGIQLFGKAKEVNYVAYFHDDTAHPHLHIVVADFGYNLSSKFCTLWLQPYLNTYLQDEFISIQQDREKQEYILSVDNIGQSKVDYDIKRNCSFDSTGLYLVYDEEKEKKKTPSWKKPYIEKRVQILIQDGLARRINGSLVFLKDFIYRKILLGKLYFHRQNLKDIQLENVKDEIVPRKEIKKVLSSIQKKNITSFVVENSKGAVCYFERKIRK